MDVCNFAEIGHSSAAVGVFVFCYDILVPFECIFDFVLVLNPYDHSMFSSTFVFPLHLYVPLEFNLHNYGYSS